MSTDEIKSEIAAIMRLLRVRMEREQAALLQADVEKLRKRWPKLSAYRFEACTRNVNSEES
jgi:class 3 adenylate cyclase